MAEIKDALNRYAGAENAEGSVLREEEQFLRDYDPSAFEHPSVTVDILLFTVEERQLKVLLVRRATPPFKGRWAIPGGFLRMEESAEEAAARRIREEAGVEGVHLEQLYTFSAVDRDPRTRVISIAYLATVPAGQLRFGAGEETAEAALFRVGIGEASGEGAPEENVSGKGVSDGAGRLLVTAADGTVLPPEEIAFDHAEILLTALQRMRGKIGYTDLAFGFLEDPQSFTLAELRYVHEAILGHKLDVGNFRRTIKRDYEAAGRIGETEIGRGEVGRPAMQYRVIH